MEIFLVVVFCFGRCCGGKGDVSFWVWGRKTERLQVLLQGDSYRIVMLFTIVHAGLNKHLSLRERNNHDSKNTFLL